MHSLAILTICNVCSKWREILVIRTVTSLAVNLEEQVLVVI